MFDIGPMPPSKEAQKRLAVYLVDLKAHLSAVEEDCDGQSVVTIWVLAKLAEFAEQLETFKDTLEGGGR